MTLTVKFHGRPQDLTYTTKIVEGDEVDIHFLRPDELMEVAVRKHGGTQLAFYCAPQGKRPEGFAEEVEFWHEAFIENAAGRTIDSVRFNR